MPRRRGRSNRGRGRRSQRNSAQTQVLREIEANTRAERTLDPPGVKDKIPMQMSERNMVTLKRMVSGAGIGVSTSTSLFGGAYYALASFDSTSEIAENWQFYRIIEITVKFIPISNFTNVIDESNDAVQDMGFFYTVIDYRDDTPAPSIATLQQYKNCQVVRTGQFVSRTFTPHAAFYGYSETAGVPTFTNYGVVPSNFWFNANSSGVQYYGIKWAIGQVVGVANGSEIYRTEVTAVIQCMHAL